MNKGSALLISVLVLTTILGTFAIVGVYSFLNEKSTLRGVQAREQAEALATGCMEEALARLARNQAYAGNETLTIGADSCSIRSVSQNGSVWILEAEAQVREIPAQLRVTLSSRSPVTITNWERVSSF